MALGGVLSFLGASMGFIPYIGMILCLLFSFFPLGYSYKIFRDHLLGGEGPLPKWGEWGYLFSRGLVVFLIALGYGIIPWLLYRLGIAFWEGGGLAAFFGVIVLILGAGVALVALFFLPMALALYSLEGGSFVAAVQWERIGGKIRRVQGEYVSSWLSGLILFLILFLLRSQLPYIGWILYAFGSFYLSLAMAHLFGKVCREAEGRRP